MLKLLSPCILLTQNSNKEPLSNAIPDESLTNSAWERSVQKDNLATSSAKKLTSMDEENAFF